MKRNTILRDDLNKDQATQVCVDQVGYCTNDPAKCAYVDGGKNSTFEIVCAVTDNRVYTGNLKKVGYDFPTFNVADFSDFKEVGRYYILIDDVKSCIFEINDNIYENTTYKAMRYFTYQREGDTYLNVEGHPTFIDDGIRSDNGEHMDVVGGWNDANDYRRWTFCLGYALIALPMAQEAGGYAIDILAYNKPGSNGVSDFLDEAKWGAEYFLKMQDSLKGYIYPYCGADNTFYITDNIVGTTDDREIVIEREDNQDQGHRNLFIQHEVAAGIALVSIQYYDIDREYALKLKKAAERIWAYTEERRILEPMTKLADFSFKTLCSINMYRMALKFTNDISEAVHYQKAAICTINELLELQETDNEAEIGGWFYSSIDKTKTNTDAKSLAWTGGLSLLAIVEGYKYLRDYTKDSSKWLNAAIMYIGKYVKPFADNNPFGYIPIDIIKSRPEEGYARQFKESDIYYRYFPTQEGWGVGNNGGLLGNAAAMLSAVDSGMLDNYNDLKNYCIKHASQIVHLIHGANPHNVSYMRGNGIQPSYYVTARGKLDIPGALIGGAMGSTKDEPVLVDGYHSHEYWTPYNSFYLLTMAYLKKLGVINTGTKSKPEAPIITAVNGNGNGACIEFKGPQNATTYKVLYGMEPGKYTSESYGYLSPVFIDGLKPYNTYYMAMTANGPGGESELSNEVVVEVDGKVTFVDFMKDLCHCYSSNGLAEEEGLIKVKKEHASIIYNSMGAISSFEISLSSLFADATVIIEIAVGDVGEFKNVNTFDRYENDNATIFTMEYLPSNTKYIKISFRNAIEARISRVQLRADEGGISNWWERPNIAVLAKISASSIHDSSIYDINKLNDGIMMMDWNNSWTNDASKGLPAWVDLDFNKPVEINRVEILTLPVYEIDSYVLQQWNGSEWQDLIVRVEGNICATRYHEFEQVVTSRIRVVCFKGCERQPDVVRLCEIVVKN